MTGLEALATRPLDEEKLARFDMSHQHLTPCVDVVPHIGSALRGVLSLNARSRGKHHTCLSPRGSLLLIIGCLLDIPSLSHMDVRRCLFGLRSQHPQGFENLYRSLTTVRGQIRMMISIAWRGRAHGQCCGWTLISASCNAFARSIAEISRR